MRKPVTSIAISTLSKMIQLSLLGLRNMNSLVTAFLHLAI